MKHKIVFFGTPDFAVTPLKTLIENRNFEVVAVATQPDRPAGRGMKVSESEVAKLAQQKGLKTFKPERVKDSSFIQELKELKAESGVVVAFGQILSQELIDIFPKGLVNIHASLLPRWRGAAPIQRALEAGDRVTGVTLQRIVQKLDAGPIIGAREYKIGNLENADSLYEHLKSLGSELLNEEYIKYLEDKLNPREQDSSKVTIAKKIEKNEGLINWSDKSTEIFNKFRAFSVWPNVWTTRKGKNLKIKEMEIAEGYEGTPGKVLKVLEDSIVVACGVGALKLIRVQPESKASMAVKEYLAGNPIKVGESINE